jgi:DNA-binding NarL/FixJ family response regulator
MNSEAVILVLDDERAQILSLRAQLKGLGVLAEFSDPNPALAYVRQHPCDAAIVDIGMPRASMDGLAFLRAIREFDRDLAIIIRTGNDSEHIADGAIELRAIKRAVKSKTTLAELRQSTRDAIAETRQRRASARSAAAAAFTRSQLAEALGTYDLRQAAADLQRGLVQTMRNRLTALSALAAVLQTDAKESGGTRFSDHAATSAALVADLLETVNTFLDGPYGDRRSAAHAGINESLRALRQFFRGAERWAAENKRVKIRDLLSDLFVESSPLELLNGLRHLIEYLFVQSPAGSEVALTASVLLPAELLRSTVAEAQVVLNGEALAPGKPYVALRASSAIPGLNLAAVQEAFSQEGGNPRTGNLTVLTRALNGTGGAVLLNRSSSGTVTVTVLLRVAL